MYESNFESIHATGTRGNTKGKACGGLFHQILHITTHSYSIAMQ
jgi:hypothetical protein